MAEINIIGNLVTLESTVPIVDPNEGLFWKQVFVGLQANLYTQRDLLNIQPDQRVEIKQRNGPVYELTVITPDYIDGQSSALNKYDLITHEVDKSILDHPKIQALGAGMRSDLQDWIKKRITPTLFGSDDQAICYSKLVLGGGAARTLGFERTFKYSIVTSFRYGILASEHNVGKLWTAAQIITPSFSGIIFPASTRFDLLVINANSPADVAKSISNPGGTNPLTETYQWRWLKLGPETESLPSGKVRISQSFLGDMWSNWEYDQAT